MDDNNYYQANTSAGSGASQAADNAGDDKPVDVPITQTPDDEAAEEQEQPVKIDTPENTADETSEKTTDTSPEDTTAGGTQADDTNPIDTYNNFVDRLIKEFGYDKLEEPQKSKLIDAIKQRIETRVLRVLMTNLTQEESDEIDKEVKEKGLREEDIVKLLSEKSPNAAQAILVALDDLYLEMKQENDAIMKAAQNQTGQ